MATLTRDDVIHIAQLSNLTLTDEEIEKFTPQLEKIVEFVSQLKEVDTTGVEPFGNPARLENVLRDDVILPSGIVINDFFKVKSILKNRTNT